MYFSLETAFFQSNGFPFLDEIFVGTQNSNFYYKSENGRSKTEKPFNPRGYKFHCPTKTSKAKKKSQRDLINDVSAKYGIKTSKGTIYRVLQAKERILESMKNATKASKNKKNDQ